MTAEGIHTTTFRRNGEFILQTIVNAPDKRKWLVVTACGYEDPYVRFIDQMLGNPPCYRTKAYLYHGRTAGGLPDVGPDVGYIRCYRPDEDPRCGHAYAVKRILEGEIILTRDLSQESIGNTIQMGEEDY